MGWGRWFSLHGKGLPELHRKGVLPQLTSFAIVDVALPKALLEGVGIEKMERQHVSCEIPHSETSQF